MDIDNNKIIMIVIGIVIVLIIGIAIFTGGDNNDNNNSTDLNNTSSSNVSTSVSNNINISSATLNSEGTLTVKFSSDALKGYDLEDSSQIGIEYFLIDKEGYRDKSITYPTGTYEKAKFVDYLIDQSSSELEEKGYKSIEINVYDVGTNTIIANGKATIQ